MISRSTKCFSAFHGTDLNGAFPKGFYKWLEQQGWIEGAVCHLCSGRTQAEGFKIDIRPEMNPDLVIDASKTGLPDNRFDTVVIDPPYSEELAHKLYKTREHYHSVNAFVKEGARLSRKRVISLSYEIPKIPKGYELLAVWGIYTVPHTSFMRCLAVFEKSLPVPSANHDPALSGENPTP